MPSLCDTCVGPEELREPVPPVRTAGLDREKDEQGQMFLGAKLDGLTIRRE
jgi:hypothetical protein